MGLSILSLIIPLSLGYILYNLIEKWHKDRMYRVGLKSIPKRVNLVDIAKNFHINFRYKLKYTSDPIDLKSILDYTCFDSGIFTINLQERFYLELFIKYYIEKYPAYKEVYNWGRGNYIDLSEFIHKLREEINIWQIKR